MNHKSGIMDVSNGIDKKLRVQGATHTEILRVFGVGKNVGAGGNRRANQLRINTNQGSESLTQYQWRAFQPKYRHAHQD